MTDSKRETLIYLSLLILFSFLITGYRISLVDNFIGYYNYLNQDYGKPFVTRALIIWIVMLFKNYLGFFPSRVFPLLEVIAFILSGYVFSKYINTFFINLTISRILSFTLYFILIFEMILPRYQPLWFPYDAYSLLFFILGLYFIRKGVFNHWYYLIFIVATFNRETTIFLSLIMLLATWKQIKHKTLFVHFFAQSFIWILIKLFLDWLFIDQTGRIFQHQYLSNVSFLTDNNYEIRLPVFIELFFRPAYLIGNFGFIYLLIIVFWNKLDNHFLRKSVMVLIPFTLSMLYVGNIYEYRIFTEMIPIILMPTLYILTKILQSIKLSEE